MSTIPKSPLHHARRPSFSWLHKPQLSISEPKLEAVNRRGPLGSGAMVVRTPRDALAPIANHPQADSGFYEGHDLPALPDSPPLPAVPTSVSAMSVPFCPPTPSQVPLPISPDPSPPRPCLKIRSSMTTDQQPPFDALLLSNLPANLTKLNPMNILVSIETASTTMKTTLATLVSQSSHLASYLEDLVVSSTSSTPVQGEDQDAESSKSSAISVPATATTPGSGAGSSAEPDSAFTTLFQNHLATAGLVPFPNIKRRADPTAHLHVFLDRPSAPYTHILTFLRTRSPTTLPRAASFLPASSQSKLDALSELRDEAQYLGLDLLYRLCTEELNLAHRYRMSHRIKHSRGDSSSHIPAPAVPLPTTMPHSLSESGTNSTYTVRELTLDDRGRPRISESTSGGFTGGRGQFSMPLHKRAESQPVKYLPPINGLQLRLQERPNSQERARPPADWI